MKIAYIIMAYKDPEQIQRLVRAMNHPAFHFYIHVDAKYSPEPFMILRNEPNVFFFRKNFVIYWAAWNFTRTLIWCIREVLDSGRQYDFIASFSGQDYPIRSNDLIVEYHLNHIGSSFFSLEDSSSPWWNHAVRRVSQYHLTNYSFPGRYKLQDLLNKLLPERKFSFYPRLYGGPRATWWTMSAEAADFVSDTILRNKKLQRFCRFTWCPDEFLIPTVLMNSPFSETLIPDSGRYIDWSQGGANPKILRVDDFQPIMASGKLYARKFDIHVDSRILDLIDAERTKPSSG